MNIGDNFRATTDSGGSHCYKYLGIDENVNSCNIKLKDLQYGSIMWVNDIWFNLRTISILK